MELNKSLQNITFTLISDNKLIKIDIPKIPANFTGSGDLFAALFLAHTYLQDNIKTAVEKTINSLYSVLLKTYEYSKGTCLLFVISLHEDVKNDNNFFF